MSNAKQTPRYANPDLEHRRHEPSNVPLTVQQQVPAKRGSSIYPVKGENAVLDWTKSNQGKGKEFRVDPHKASVAANTIRAANAPRAAEAPDDGVVPTVAPPASPGATGNRIKDFYVSVIPMFDPRSKWRQRWDLLLMLFICLNAICVPIDVAGALTPTNGINVLNNIADTFFLIDILVSFRTGFVEKKFGIEYLHARPLDVGYNYLKGWFMVDILSIGVPYNLLDNPDVPYSVRQTGKGLGLLKLLRLARLPRLLKRILKVPLKWKLLVRVLMLVVLYLFVCHLLGCALLFLGEHPGAPHELDSVECGPHANETCTWTITNNLEGQPDNQRYATAFYFAVTTSISVGYGDISATNHVETVVLTMCMLITMLLTTVLFGSIVTIVDKLGDAKRRYDERKQAIEHFISSYHIEAEAAIPMREMVEYQWERTKFFDTEAVLDILPAPLRTQVLLDINKTFMFTVPFFQDQDEAIIKQIVQALGHELVLPGTLVVHEGQPADKMYFSRFGEFEVLAPHSYVVVQNIKTGGYFGEIGLLVNHGRYSATVRASPKTRCELATLSRGNLNKLMNTFPVFRQTFRQVGLSRLRSTRRDFLKSRFAGQSEYRIVFEVIKGHNILLGEAHPVIMAEVVTQTCRKRRSKAKIFGVSSKTTKGPTDSDTYMEGDDNDLDQGQRRIGLVHRTDRRRGNSPQFGNVFVIEICCHEMQRIESLELVVTLYQCHSWRPRSYIGSFKVHPIEIRLGQVTKQWYRLKNMETPSECDVLMNACQAERQGKFRTKKKPLGQLLLRMIRHRDSGGRDAQLRHTQGIRELSSTSRNGDLLTAEHSAALKRQEKILQMRSRIDKSTNSDADVEDIVNGKKKRSWKKIKQNFLASHTRRSKKFSDGLQLGAQMTLLDEFDSALTQHQKEGSNIASGDMSALAGIASKESCDSMDRSIDQCATLFSLGQQLQERLALMAQKREGFAGPGDEPNNETLLSAPADSGGKSVG
eukprot:g5126.t1